MVNRVARVADYVRGRCGNCFLHYFMLSMISSASWAGRRFELHRCRLGLKNNRNRKLEDFDSLEEEEEEEEEKQKKIWR